MWDAVWNVYSLNHSIVIWFVHLYSTGFQLCVVVMVLVYSHLPFYSSLRCSNTFYMHDMDVGCILKGFTASNMVEWHVFHTNIAFNFSQQLSWIWGTICGGNGVNVHPFDHCPQKRLLKHLVYVWNWCGMQFERFYNLNLCIVTWCALPHHNKRFLLTHLNLGKLQWW